MTVFKNVSYPLELRKVNAATTKEKVRKALSLVGLEGFEDRPAPILSGGQQQRVALHGPWSTNPRFFCWMSHSVIWMRNFANRCEWSLNCCSRGLESL